MKLIIIISLTFLFSGCSINHSLVPSQDENDLGSNLSVGSGKLIPTNSNNSLVGSYIQNFTGSIGSSDINNDVPCPNLQRGFRNLDRAIVTNLYEHSEFSIFEVNCDNEAEKDFTTKLNHSPGSIHSIVYYNKENNTIKTLPIFESDTNQFNKIITSSTYERYIIGISEKSTPEKITLDILSFDSSGNANKVGEIEPSSFGESEIVPYPDGIAYFSNISGELRLFNFSSKKDQLIAKDVIQFVSVYSDGGSKVFNEGWNLFYYGYPDGVGGIIEDDSKFQPSWVDVRFYTFNNNETRNTLTIKRQTELLGGIAESSIALDSDLIKTYDLNNKAVLFFGPDRIE